MIMLAARTVYNAVRMYVPALRELQSVTLEKKEVDTGQRSHPSFEFIDGE